MWVANTIKLNKIITAMQLITHEIIITTNCGTFINYIKKALATGSLWVQLVMVNQMTTQERI
jgi:hypothetical protein